MRGTLSRAFPPPERGRDREGVSLAWDGDDLHPNPALFNGREHIRALGLIAAMSLLLTVPPASAAGDVKAGRQKALQCQTCHGLDGLSKIPDAPNIAGSPEGYLAKQLNAFRKGERKNDMMSIVAQQLSEQDVADLAAYYAAIEVTVQVPR
jgi:cytochrome c553